MSLLYEIQLQWIHSLHLYRSTALDHFFRVLHFCDSFAFYSIACVLLWVFYGRRLGIGVTAIFLFSKIVNSVLKGLFLSPRPFHLHQELMVAHASGLGFPSGAAQSVILLSGILILLWKSPWKWLFVSIYIPLISFSRVYLGVHFPMDIVAGWFVGFGLLFVYSSWFPLIENRLFQEST